MDELGVWDVFNVFPFDFNGPWPFSALVPHVWQGLLVVDPRNHFGHAAKMLGLIDAEKQMDIGISNGFFGVFVEIFGDLIFEIL